MSLQEKKQTDVGYAVARLDSWLQTMRGPRGYGGPISHWWESSLLYCGPMADWRYEGIIDGYVTLFRSTGEPIWLDRARQAGEDLVAAQLPSGNYRNSAFQQGPMEGGTPHEAAADVGLLELARLLREHGYDNWRRYFDVAQRNIESFLLGRLWNGRGFLDQPWNTTLVPNKNGTTIEALVLYEALSGRDMSEYLWPAARVILEARELDGPRRGATIHVGTGRHRLAIGIYTARAACGLLRLYEREPCQELLDAVRLALDFIRGLYTPEGPYFGRYPGGKPIANPRIIAGAGDILRVMVWGRKYDLAVDQDIDAIVDLLIRSQLPSGGIPTGYGFAARGDSRPYHGLPEFRDVLPVVGWCDKAFRALTKLVDETPDLSMLNQGRNTRIPCVWKGRDYYYTETEREIMLPDRRSGRSPFHWVKGESYPLVYVL